MNDNPPEIEEEKLQQEKGTSEQDNSSQGQQIRPMEMKESQAVTK